MITLVLLPGMDGTGDLFAPFISALGSDFTVITVRYPTAGPQDYTALRDIAQSALPSGRPFVLLGESFSGPVAVSLAASEPAGLVGLILCCSFVRNPWPLLNVLHSLVQLLPVKWIPVTLLNRVLLGRFATQQLRSAFNQTLARVSPDALRARMRAVLKTDVSTELKRIRIPSLYLRATEDRIIPPYAAELFSSSMPRSCIVDLEAPHFLLQAVPSEAACVIREFLREVAQDCNLALQTDL